MAGSNREGGITMIIFKNTLNFASLVVALAAAIPAALAAPVGPLTPLVAGQPAKASDVNGNFSTIVTTVNANDTRLTTVETTKQNIVTGTCVAGSAIRAIASNGTVTCQSAGGNVGYASVNAAVAVPETGTTPTILGVAGGGIGRYQQSGGSDFLVAPIVLPQGATITALSFTCFRNNAASCTAFLYRDDINLITSISIPAQSTTAQTATSTTIATSPAGLPVVDNQNFSYIVIMSLSGTATSNIMPIKAAVSYTLP
jgi:hypothetical protein